MSGTDTLAGALWLRPGTPRPHNLRSSRPDFVARVARGLPAARLPAALGSLFSLCSHAHVVCAGMAVKVALGAAEPVSEGARAQLALQTLREHMRRMALDWPRQLATGDATEVDVEVALDAAARALAACPAFAKSPGSAVPWLESEWLGMPALDWLQAWTDDPAAWLGRWARGRETVVAKLLRGCEPLARTATPFVPALLVHAHAESLRSCAARLRHERAAYARQPRWQGECAETGVWTRLNDRARARLDTPWLRLGARLAEAVRLALPAARDAVAGPQGPRAHEAAMTCGAGWLDLGALALADGEAIAWVEMARGLLLHHVQLDGRGDAATVATCHVIAPTDWNFHPDGAVARALEHTPEYPTGEGQRRLAALLAAYDPCVPVEHEQPLPREAAHA